MSVVINTKPIEEGPYNLNHDFGIVLKGRKNLTTIQGFWTTNQIIKW